MRRLILGLSLSLLIAVPAAAQDAPADLILTGGRVYTPDGWAESVAVRDGVIEAVGDDERVLALRGTGTRLIELNGAPLFPGFNDMHAHPFIGGMRRFAPCRVPVQPAAAVLEATAACARAVAPGEWIIAGPIFLAGITRHELDAVAPANPIILQAEGGHDVVVNSLALAAAGIERNTTPPPGAVIVRDDAGEPNGLLSDVGDLVTGHLPPPSPDISRRGALYALEMMRAAGVTSVTDANFIPVAARPTFAALADSGELKMRVRGCTQWALNDDAQAVIDVLVSGTYDRELFDTRCVKIFLDGTFGPSRTAALFEPYLNADGSSTGTKGGLLVPQDALTAAVVRFDKAGLTVLIHASGDAAVDAALTAIEAARATNGPSGLPHQIAHAFVVRVGDIPRAMAAGAVLEFTSPAPITVVLLGRELGRARLERAAPAREALEAGVMAVGSTDWPSGAPAYNLWAEVQVLANRGGDQAVSYGQRVTLEQAIAMFTSYPAQASRDPTAPGIIATGRKADFIVLDRNPFEVPDNQVAQTKIVKTILGGEVVYEAPPSQ